MLEDYYWDELVVVLEEYGILNDTEENAEDGSRYVESESDLDRFIHI